MPTRRETAQPQSFPHPELGNSPTKGLFGRELRPRLLLGDQAGEDAAGADAAAVAGEDQRLQLPEVGAGHQPVAIADDRHVLMLERGFEHAAGAANLTDVAIAGGSWGIYQSGGTLSATTTRVTNNTYGVYVVGGTSSSFDRCSAGFGAASIGSATARFRSWITFRARSIVTSSRSASIGFNK